MPRETRKPIVWRKTLKIEYDVDRYPSGMVVRELYAFWRGHGINIGLTRRSRNG